MAGTFCSGFFFCVITEKLKHFLKIYRNTKTDLAQREANAQQVAALLTDKAKGEGPPPSARGPADMRTGAATQELSRLSQSC